MIIEGIITIFVNVLGGLFGSGVAGVFIDKMFEFMDVLIPYVRVMLYILPATTILTMFRLIVVIQGFKISVSLIKLLVNLIPGY